MENEAPKKTKAGYSLIEVMVASLIFMIVSVGFSMGMLAALHTHTMAAEHYRATSLARNRVQHARSLDFFSLMMLNENNTRVDDQGNKDSQGRFYRTTSVVASGTNTVEVIAQVWFPRPFGKLSTQPVEIMTKISMGM